MAHRAGQSLTVVAVLCSGAFCGVAIAQSGGDEAQAGEENAPTFDEEIVVRGTSREALRIQIRMAEEAVFARFNEINSNDEFDIHCRRVEETGSRIPRRRCEPNFWRDAQARYGSETARRLQGGIASSGQEFLGEASHKYRLLDEEMRQLAADDPQLGQALTHLGELQDARNEGVWPQAAPTASREVEQGDGPMPYDAAAVTEASIGREKWRHELTQRTFTIAQVYGEIGAIAVDCDARTARLEWDAGVEWTLPEEWGACAVSVEAAPGSSLALYEFDQRD